MKCLPKLLLLTFLNYHVSIVFAQDETQLINICTNYCSRNLSIAIPNVTIRTTLPIPYVLTHNPNTFKDVRYTENDCDDQHELATICETIPEAILKYQVYYPSNHNYSICKLPALILFHAGGFDEMCKCRLS